MATRVPPAARAALALSLLVPLAGCTQTPDLGVEVNLVEGLSGSVQRPVSVGGTVLALVTEDVDAPATGVLRSTDGGRSFTTVDTGLGDLGDRAPSAEYPATQLWAADPWVVAAITVPNLDDVVGRTVAVSPDRGESWSLVELPAPAAHPPQVTSATSTGDALVLGGSLGDDAYDAAIWRLTSLDDGFELITAPALSSSGDYFKAIEQIAFFDGRLIAVGSENERPGDSLLGAWEADASGAGWAPMETDAGIRFGPGVGPLTPGQDALTVPLSGDLVGLAAGSSTWTVLGPDPRADRGGTVAVPGGYAWTWTEYPVDNSAETIAHLGEVVDGDVVGEVVALDCESDRPSTRVSAPQRLGGAAIAVLGCSGGSPEDSIVITTDAGRDWAAVPLHDDPGALPGGAVASGSAADNLLDLGDAILLFQPATLPDGSAAPLAVRITM